MATKTSPKKNNRKGAASYGNFLAKPNMKIFPVIVFAALFGLIGYQLIATKAGSVIPTASDEIVVQYMSLNGSHSQELADGSITNAIQPNDVLLTGDGNLYCNLNADANGDGRVTKSRLTAEEIKQLYKKIDTSDIKTAAKQNKRILEDVRNSISKLPPEEVAEANTSITSELQGIEDLAVIVVNANDGATVLYNRADSTNAFARTYAFLNSECTSRKSTELVNTLPVLKDPVLPSTEPAPSVEALEALGIVGRAEAAGFSKTDEDKDASRVNYHRNTKHGLPSYTKKRCLKTVARNWAYKMASAQTLMHNPNVGTQIASKCGHHYGYSENVGTGSDEGTVWNAFLASCPHKANIDDQSTTSTTGVSCSRGKIGQNSMGIGVYRDANNRVWIVQVFARL